jgi:hypothetical protein
MALTPSEEAAIRALLAQDSALLSLAGNEAPILAKLAAESVTIPELDAASAINAGDLFVVNQSGADRAATAALVGAPFFGDAGLTALVGLSPAADRLAYFTSSSGSALAVITAAARELLNDGNYSTMLSTLGFTANAKSFIAADYAGMREQLGVLGYGSNTNGDWVSLRILDRTYYLQMMEQNSGANGEATYTLPVAFTAKGWVVASPKTTNTSATDGNAISSRLSGLSQYIIGSDDVGNRACTAIAFGY